MRSLRRLLLVSSLAMTVLHAGFPALAAGRNVVLFVADDLGPDAGCYGNRVIKTPSIDALAADGTRFTHAFTTTASCSPSRSVILTGLYSHRNGQFGLEHSYHHFRTHERVESLPVLLGRAGYRTARIGKFHVGPEEVYKFDEVLTANARNTVAMAEACSALIRARDDRPFFLYFATADPHRSGERAAEVPERPDRFGNKPPGESHPGIGPVTYKPEDVAVPPFLPDTPECRAELAQYYQSASRVDQGLGRLIQILQDAGKWDETLFLLLSDNGIPFPGAKTTAYEPGLRLPCIARNPYLEKRGLVTDAMINWADITPTILEFAGAPAAQRSQLDGRSFLGILDKPRSEGWDEVYASHTFHEVTMYYPMRVVRGRRYKLIWNIAHALPFPFASDLWNSATWQGIHRLGGEALYGKRRVGVYIHRPQFELYDLENDPHEITNLAADPERAKLLVELKAKLKAFQERTKDPWLLKWTHE